MSQIYEFTFGDFQCMVLQDGITVVPVAQFWDDAHESERQQVLETNAIDPDNVELSTNVLLLERDGRRILIDTGNISNTPS